MRLRLAIALLLITSGSGCLSPTVDEVVPITLINSTDEGVFVTMEISGNRLSTAWEGDLAPGASVEAAKLPFGSYRAWFNWDVEGDIAGRSEPVSFTIRPGEPVELTLFPVNPAWRQTA